MKDQRENRIFQSVKWFLKHGFSYSEYPGMRFAVKNFRDCVQVRVFENRHPKSVAFTAYICDGNAKDGMEVCHGNARHSLTMNAVVAVGDGASAQAALCEAVHKVGARSTAIAFEIASALSL